MKKPNFWPVNLSLQINLLNSLAKTMAFSCQIRVLWTFFCKAFFWKVLFSLSKINFWKGTNTWNCKKFRWKQRQRRCFQWSSMTYFVVQKLSPRAATGGEPQNIISQTKKFRPFAIRFFHLTYSISSLPLLSEPSSPTKPESTVLQKFAHTDTLSYGGERIYLDVSSFLHLTNIHYVYNFIIKVVFYSQSLAQTPTTLGITLGAGKG